MSNMTMPFQPSWGSNQLLTLAVATEQHVRINKDWRSLRVFNTGTTNPLYFKTYNSGTTSATLPAPSALTPPQANASTADYRVNPNASALVTFALDHDAISIVSAAGTTAEVMGGTGGI